MGKEKFRFDSVDFKKKEIITNTFVRDGDRFQFGPETREKSSCGVAYTKFPPSFLEFPWIFIRSTPHNALMNIVSVRSALSLRTFERAIPDFSVESRYRLIVCQLIVSIIPSIRASRFVFYRVGFRIDRSRSRCKQMLIGSIIQIGKKSISPSS